MHKLLQKSYQTISHLFIALKFAYHVDKKLVITYYATIAIGSIMPYLAAYAMKILIDQLGIFPASQSTISTITLAVIAYLVVLGIEDIAYWGLNQNYYDYLLRNKLQNALTYSYAEKISQLDAQHLEDSDIQNEMTKVEMSYSWKIPDALRIFGYLFRHIVGGVVGFFAVVTMNWWIPILIVLSGLGRTYFKIKHGNFVWSMYGSGAPDIKKLYYLDNLLTSQSSIIESRIFQSTKTLLHKYRSLQDHLYTINAKPLHNYRFVIIGFGLVEMLILGLLFYDLSTQALHQSLTVGSITFIIISVLQFRGNCVWGSGQVGQLYEHALFIKPYFDLLALPKLIKEKKNAHKFKIVQPPHIEFKHVSFNYPNGRQVLKDVSFTINPGENIALVGVNGAGKTTIIKLLCRFYDVTSGEILVNGINIKELNLANWYAHLGTLFQQFVQYNFTVQENIMLGAPHIHDKKRMRLAAEQSGAWDFIQKLPKQYDQMLGRRFEDGEELSGGQWQKLAIARAFYEQAPVLIMDEPTSAIDAEAEFEIFNNLEKVYKDKTLLLVSHRFSTVRNAQKIIVLDNGEIIEQGSHQELLQKGGKYAAMFTTQAKGYR